MELHSFLSFYFFIQLRSLVRLITQGIWFFFSQWIFVERYRVIKGPSTTWNWFKLFSATLWTGGGVPRMRSRTLTQAHPSCPEIPFSETGITHVKREQSKPLKVCIFIYFNFSLFWFGPKERLEKITQLKLYLYINLHTLCIISDGMFWDWGI